jgi:hypothetical protein
VDGTEVRQVGDRVAHAEDGGGCLLNMSLKVQQVIVHGLQRQPFTESGEHAQQPADESIAVTLAPARASGMACIPNPAPRSMTTSPRARGRPNVGVAVAGRDVEHSLVPSQGVWT